MKYSNVNMRQKALRKDFQNVDPLLPGNNEISVIKKKKHNSSADPILPLADSADECMCVFYH